MLIFFLIRGLKSIKFGREEVFEGFMSQKANSMLFKQLDFLDKLETDK